MKLFLTRLGRAVVLDGVKYKAEIRIQPVSGDLGTFIVSPQCFRRNALAADESTVSGNECLPSSEAAAFCTDST